MSDVAEAGTPAAPCETVPAVIKDIKNLEFVMDMNKDGAAGVVSKPIDNPIIRKTLDSLGVTLQFLVQWKPDEEYPVSFVLRDIYGFTRRVEFEGHDIFLRSQDNLLTIRLTGINIVQDGSRATVHIANCLITTGAIVVGEN